MRRSRVHCHAMANPRSGSLRALTSKLQLTHELHFAQLESVGDYNSPDLRLESDLSVGLADFSGQGKHVHHDGAIFQPNHFGANWPDVPLPIALQESKILQRLA